ncbi:putative T7SS-secreted protein [uncultured Microbacterium sp.]|uniref:putative T7SS-secreted protein n=1 Tax=uncultured Microbacterium sp. TaxID=191216 RepID=UPI00345C08CE
MELGQTQSAADLVPGSVSEVRTTAEAWKARGAEATRVRDDLATLDDDGTWRGAAYYAYLDRFERQLLHWKHAGESLRAGASALFTWADALQWAQDEADRAITLWNEAEQQAAAALAAHRAHVRELRVGQGLRHPEADVPFVDPSGPAHDEAREVLFNARATLEVYARDCAIRLDDAADAARIPLTDAEAATRTQHATTEVIVNLAVVQPFRATMDMLAISAQTLWEHPDIILELLGGAATFLGGAALAAGGGAITVTGAGALAGSPALVVAGVGVAGAGATMMGDAACRWLTESHGAGDRVHGLNRGDRRDYEGKFAAGENPAPWVDKEKIGLEQYERREQSDVIRSKVKVDYEGSPQNGRSYDGLVKNDDGPNTYTGIEVKSGNAIDGYNRPGSTQRQFDEAVDGGTPARGKLDGEEILVTRVEIEIVP